MKFNPTAKIDKFRLAGCSTGFKGNLAVNAVGVGLSVPFQFRILSEARGDLKVTAVDEFTYYAAGAPPVSNATVVVRDTISRAVVTNGVTDLLGQLFVPQLMEGYYDIEVSADRHNSYRGTHLVLSGTTNEVSTFISRQTVRYTWTVERIEIEDRSCPDGAYRNGIGVAESDGDGGTDREG
jgi:hypothetical protein